MKQLHGGLLSILALTACDGVFVDPAKTPDASSPDAPPIDGTIVFTTSEQYQGIQLGGVEGADAICASAASRAGLAGDFKAWISQLGNSATDRLTHSTKPYILVNRTTKVADSWVDLLNFDLLHAIDLDENGAALVPQGISITAPVWTATGIDGRATSWMPAPNFPRPDCAHWTDSFELAAGYLGIWTDTGTAWTAASAAFACDETAHLYCFQQ